MRFLDYRHKKPVLNNSVDKDGSGKPWPFSPFRFRNPKRFQDQ